MKSTALLLEKSVHERICHINVFCSWCLSSWEWEIPNQDAQKLYENWGAYSSQEVECHRDTPNFCVCVISDIYPLRTLTKNTNLSQRLVIYLCTFWRRFDHQVFWAKWGKAISYTFLNKLCISEWPSCMGICYGQISIETYSLGNRRFWALYLIQFLGFFFASLHSSNFLTPILLSITSPLHILTCPHFLIFR